MSFEEDDLEAQLDELTRHNEQVRRENELYQSYLDRNIQAVTTAEEEDRRERAQKQRGRKPKQVQTLTMEQKNEIASSELEEVSKDARLSETPNAEEDATVAPKEGEEADPDKTGVPLLAND